MARARPRPLRRVKVGLLGADLAAGDWVDRVRRRGDLTVVGFGQPGASPALAEALGLSEVGVDALLLDDTVEAVVVAGPAEERANWVMRAASASKAVLLAVPGYARLSAWQRPLTKALDASVPFLATFGLRFDARVQRLKSAVSMGRVGRLLSVNIHHADRSHGRGPVDGLLPSLDLVRWLTGESPFELHAVEGAGRAGQGVGLVVVLKFPSGVTAVLQRVRRDVEADGHRIEVIGDKATIAVAHESSGGPRLGDAALEHFVDSLLRDDPHLAGPEDLRAALKMLDGVEVSIRSGQAVTPTEDL